MKLISPMLDLVPVTIWFKHNDQYRRWDFNHLSDGHEQGMRPKPKHPDQATAWGKGGWDARHKWMRTDVVPPRVVDYTPEDIADMRGDS